MPSKIQVTFDCAEPERLATFWATVLSYEVQPSPDGYSTWEEFAIDHGIPGHQRGSISAIVDPEGDGPRLFFQRVPESKSAKNRVHLDVNVSRKGAEPDERRTQIDAEVERLVTAGATKQDAVEERGGYWVVMTDPEGNEFWVQ